MNSNRPWKNFLISLNGQLALTDNHFHNSTFQMRDTFSYTLHEVAKSIPNIFIIVADISPAASMEPFRKEFPDRFYNVGVSEQSMISLCTGLALRGCNPFAYTIAPFAIYRPFEHIRVELCYQNLPVTIVGVGAGVAYSVAGATHNAIEDIGIMSALPNMSIIAPCDPEELKPAIWACANHNGTVYLRLGKAGEPILTKNAPEPFEFKKIRKIKDGSKVAIVGYGPILSMAFEAADHHHKKTGVEPAIFSVHTLKPIDNERIRSILNEYERVIVLEEATPPGSLAGQVKQIAWDFQVSCKIRNIGLKDQFIKCYGTKTELLAAHGVTMDALLNQFTN
jgi:transketolase